MSIPQSDVAAVLERVDLLALIQEHVPLRRVGNRFVGLCPFHSESTPSFSVNAQLGVYYCFGCQASGDAISFVRHFERLDFADAVEQLAHRVGVSITRDSATDSQKRSETKLIREVLSRAIEFFAANLRDSEDGKLAQQYLGSRGITDELIARFQIGFSPRDSARLPAYLKVPAPLFAAAGLGYVDSGGRAHDMFAGRITFPIFDQSGNPVAFGGRVLPGISYPGDSEAAKYKNSPETENYAKRRTLYGLNWAKAEIVRRDRAVICEGYTDVIAFFASDLGVAVATCGTALTEDHLDRLKNFSKNIVLAFDGDKAGASATERIYEWERRFQLNVRVANFPAGEDPASLSLKDPELLRQCVQSAEPFLSFRLNRHFAAGDFSSIEGRVQLANSALSLIAEHPNPLVRGEYLMVVADRCRLDPRELERRLEREVRSYQARSRAATRYIAPATNAEIEATVGAGSEESPGRSQGEPAAKAVQHFSLSELLDPSQRPYNEALRQLAQRPAELAAFMPSFLFTHPVHTELVSLMSRCASAEQVLAEIDTLSESARGLLMRLLVETAEPDEVDVISLLIERYAQKVVDETKRSIRKMDFASPGDATEVARRISETTSYISRLRARLWDQETRDEAVGELLVYFADSFDKESSAI